MTPNDLAFMRDTVTTTLNNLSGQVKRPNTTRDLAGGVKNSYFNVGDPVQVHVYSASGSPEEKEFAERFGAIRLMYCDLPYGTNLKLKDQIYVGLKIYEVIGLPEEGGGYETCVHAFVMEIS